MSAASRKPKVSDFMKAADEIQESLELFRKAPPEIRAEIMAMLRENSNHTEKGEA
ncbi:hypothetical protein [Mesorhizobium sp. Root157]|uniref:hypothetical protein n=1 Tax=Mesorhizobium sp. Root157 TaxID=1736477 RepID=UPI000B053C5B|nr:hypothetical protein [Mesorhizobium sp. Root157]